MKKSKSVTILSILIAVLMAITSSGGLFIENLYRNNITVSSAFRGNDLIALLAAVPLLIGAMMLSKRGSSRAGLVWMGMLVYAIYNYTFYLFGAAFNWFFLFYVALCTLSIYALILGLSHLDVDEISQMFEAKTPVRLISGFMLFFSLLLGGLWVARAASFLFTGQVPQDILNTEHPTGVVYAADLTLLIPAMILGAVLLWKRQPWGYVLSAIMNIKATTYAAALIAMSPFAANAGVEGAWELVPLWAVLGAGNLISSLLLLGNMKTNVEQMPKHNALEKGFSVGYNFLNPLERGNIETQRSNAA